MRVSLRTLGYIVSIISVSTVALLIVFAYKASADSGSESLTTSPVLLNLDIGPGQSATRTIEVLNNTSAPLQINMKLYTFSASGNSGLAAVTKFPQNNPAAHYVTFDPSSFTAQPKVWSKVQVTFDLPKDASLGYYYTLVFSPVYSSSSGKAGATIRGSNAVLALINTNSANEKKNIEVSSFTSSKRVYEFLPANFNVTIKNSGNIFLAPTGDIFITRTDGGNTIDVLPVNQSGGNVLPNSERIFYASWLNGFPSYKPVTVNGQPAVNKDGQPINKVDWGNSSISKFRFGKYYANLIMTYNNGTQAVILRGQIDFYVVPWPILLGIAFILFLIGLNLFFIFRSFYRKIRKITNRSKEKEKTKEKPKPKEKA